MFVPDLSSRLAAGHSRFVPARTSRLHAFGRLALLLLPLGIAGCSSDGELSGNLGGWRPWVEGGQTGALIPPCGLTPAAAAGDSIPGGRSGIVLHTDSCAGLAVAELELHDEDGMMVSFDVERLPGGAVLLRPRSPLMAGVYRLSGAGLELEPVVAVEPSEVPARLGQLVPEATSCGADFALTLDPLVLEYLPQLKLSVSVDGGEPETWFDYGTLEVEDGRAELSLSECFPSCLDAGSHSLRVTAELAGETGTLEPLDVAFQTFCRPDGNAAGASEAHADPAACGAVLPWRRPPSGGGALLGMLLAAAALLVVRRARRPSSQTGALVTLPDGPGIEPP